MRQEKKIPVEQLRAGMYVLALDRPWFDTPFVAGGFEIRDEEDIAELRRYCRHVFIEHTREQNAFEHGAIVTSDRAVVEKVLPQAERILSRLRNTVQRLFEEAAEQQGITSLNSCDEALNGLVDSIISNADAHLWLTRLDRESCYDVAHAMDCCVLAVAFARQLGWSRQACHTLGKAALLLDIGMVRVPRRILYKAGRLTAEEFAAIQCHVAYAEEILAAAAGVNDEVLAIVRSHHERFNGSGYPRGLAGDAIALPGQLAAMVDCYTAMTRCRNYRTARSPHEVLNQIYGWRNSLFRADLVEPFIQFIGVYPTTTLVELSTGEVGAVLEQSRPRSLRPRVLLILDRNKSAYPHRRLLDLTREDCADVEIRRAVEGHTFGIELEAGLWRDLQRGQTVEDAETGQISAGC